jgi:4-hydroxy-tetrahydrodipicolinate reductase
LLGSFAEKQKRLSRISGRREVIGYKGENVNMNSKTVDPLRVALRGSTGRMGGVAMEAIQGAEDLSLVAEMGSEVVDVEKVVRRARADVVVDLTVPKALEPGIRDLIRTGADIVIGTSGVENGHLEEWEELSREYGNSVLVVPNFCLGVLLMQQLAETAMQVFSDLEIIEMHHEKKIDSPSGTASATAERLGAIREKTGKKPLAPFLEEGFRGGIIRGIPIHSLRLPGMLARQELHFGGLGEEFVISHETKNRRAFMPGLLLAIRGVGQLKGLHSGLEAVLPQAWPHVELG